MRTQVLIEKLLKNEFFINALHTVIKEIITYSFLSTVTEPNARKSANRKKSGPQYSI